VLEKQTVGTWVVLESKEGYRAIRLTELTPGRAVSYDEMRERVYTEWKEITSSQLTKNAIRELGKKYRIRDEGKNS
jgi:hypothetical protein